MTWNRHALNQALDLTGRDTGFARHQALAAVPAGELGRWAIWPLKRWHFKKFDLATVIDEIIDLVLNGIGGGDGLADARIAD
jgi:hypothetical protein